MPTIPHPDLVPMVGSWRLISERVTLTDTKECIEPRGPQPEGRMVLDFGGRIMFLFTKPDRQPPVSDVDRATLFNEMMCYTGLVQLDGPGRFTTTVDIAWNPAFGGKQVRFFVLDGDRLTITTPEHTHPRFPGRMLVADVIFEREHQV